MAVGFCLINAAPGKEHQVYDGLLKVKEISELTPVLGEYDLVAKIEVEDSPDAFYKIGQAVVDKIRTVPGVVDTTTFSGIKF